MLYVSKDKMGDGKTFYNILLVLAMALSFVVASHTLLPMYYMGQLSYNTILAIIFAMSCGWVLLAKVLNKYWKQEIIVKHGTVTVA